MHPTEKVVRQFHESWDMRDPDRGAEVISDEVLLALPIAPLHQDMGECREVTADYHASADAQRDNPFAVLEQLKQKQ